LEERYKKALQLAEENNDIGAIKDLKASFNIKQPEVNK
jgi:hypothetical protein